MRGSSAEQILREALDGVARDAGAVKDCWLSLLRLGLTRREQRVVRAVLLADTPLAVREIAQRTRLHYSHCKAVVRTLVAWKILARTPTGVSFQAVAARWGPPAVPAP